MTCMCMYIITYSVIEVCVWQNIAIMYAQGIPATYNIL